MNELYHPEAQNIVERNGQTVEKDRGMRRGDRIEIVAGFDPIEAVYATAIIDAVPSSMTEHVTIALLESPRTPQAV
jgi:hypothetical protein